ncbi:MAG: hypothetical protein AB7N61_24945 [Acidimicrobiia bacterium]
MLGISAQELVGYAASALVVLSLTMTSVVRLRLISLIGSLTFVAYGLLIDSAPIVITNISIAVINVWFLRTELGHHRDLGASPIAVDSPFLTDFLLFHLSDIRTFQPEFAMPASDAIALLLTRDGLPAGALIARRHGPELEVILDYVVRAYRDSRLGQWLFGRGSHVLRDLGVTRVWAQASTDVHRSYLQRVGFTEQGDRFVRNLS